MRFIDSNDSWKLFSGDSFDDVNCGLLRYFKALLINFRQQYRRFSFLNFKMAAEVQQQQNTLKQTRHNLFCNTFVIKIAGQRKLKNDLKSLNL